MSIELEFAPRSEAPGDVIEWARRQHDTLMLLLNTGLGRLRLVVLHVAPEKPRDGDLVYADGTNWNPGAGRGLLRLREWGMGKVMMMVEPLELGRLSTPKGEFTLGWVNHEHIGEVWPLVHQHLLANQEIWDFVDTPENMLLQLLNANLQLHVLRDENGAIKSIGITKFTTYPTALTDMLILWVSGEDRKLCLDLLASLEVWGASRGAQRCQMFGRPGWKRGLKALGYEEERITMHKLLKRRMQ